MLNKKHCYNCKKLICGQNFWTKQDLYQKIINICNILTVFDCKGKYNMNFYFKKLWI